MTTPTPDQRAALIDQIRFLPFLLDDHVAGLTAEELTTHYLPGEWSVAQNVHHLADSHMNSYIRCKLILTEKHPTFRPYDQDAWAACADAGSADLTASLALLRSLHRRWVVFWESLREDDWVRTGYHPEDDETVTLADQLAAYARHGEAHLDQIRRTLAAKPSAQPQAPEPGPVSLREVNAENIFALLRLRVAHDQRHLVAPNAVSLAQAGVSLHAWRRAIYAGETPVGFVMVDMTPGAYFVWRLMVDELHQGRGYARQAMEQVIAEVRRRGDATEVRVSYVPGPGSPQPFYAKLGFEETGEVEEGERVMRLLL